MIRGKTASASIAPLLSFACFALLFAITLALAFITLTAALLYLRPTPGFDYWVAGLPFLQSAIEGPWQWSTLWQQHAQAHHLVLSRLLFLADWYLDDFRGYGLLAANLLALAASASLVIYHLWRTPQLNQRSRWLALLLLCMASASSHHLHNLVFTFNTQWISGLLLILLSIHAVIKCSQSLTTPTRRLWGLCASVSALLLAYTTFSLPSLLLCWFLLVYFLRIPLPLAVGVSLLLVMALFGYLLNSTYLAGFSQGDSSLLAADKILALLQHLVTYVGLYLGSPLSELSRWQGLLLAAISLCLVLTVGLPLLKQRLPAADNSLWIMMLVYCAFIISMAAVTALGRFDINMAHAPRFRAFVMPFLVFAAIAALQLASRLKTYPQLAIQALVVSVFLYVLLAGQGLQLQRYSAEYDEYMPGAVAMASGLSDQEVVHESRFKMYQKENNQQILAYRDFLLRHQKGIFADPLYRQIGKPVAWLPGPAPNTPNTLAALAAGGYRWYGQGLPCKLQGKLLVINEHQAIGGGFIRRGLPDKSLSNARDMLLSHCDAQQGRLWEAYVPPGLDPGQPIRVIAYQDGVPLTIAQTVLP